ncbi:MULTISPECIES: hypothetical protein [unclassified Paenibacillus]|uniref:hypothetical protein n=1 Tax=unclassified Paenibacillus TaxID=185978 RepID=UPI00362B27B2
MRTFIVGMIIVMVLGLTGCSSPIEFNGKSENWSVTCSVDQSANVKSFLIRYTGKENQPVKDTSYSFVDSKNFNNSGKSEASSATLKISGKSTMDTPYVDEAGFKLHIKWNSKEETIDLARD